MSAKQQADNSKAAEVVPGTDGDALAAAASLVSGVKFYDPFTLGDPIPEEQNPLALFRGGWLRKGGGALLVSTTGRGKSTFLLQAMARWAAGLEFFGLAPLRPLRILCFQFENDDEEIKSFMKGIRAGAFPGMTRAEVAALASGRLRFAVGVEATADKVIEVARRECEGDAPPDIVVIDPVLAIAEGDLSKQEFAHDLFYVKLDKLAKRQKLGLVLALHTPKPPTTQADRSLFRARDLVEYLGFGSSLIPDWARGIMVLMPSVADGYFRLYGAKRGRNLGWTGPDGKRTLQRLVGWSKEGHELPYWRDVDADEFQRAEAEAKAEESDKPARKRADVAMDGGDGTADDRATPKHRAEGDCVTLALALVREPGSAASGTRLRKIAWEAFGRVDGNKVFDRLCRNPEKYNCAVVEVGTRNARFYGAGDTVDEARARAEAAAEAHRAKAQGAKVAAASDPKGGEA